MLGEDPPGSCSSSGFGGFSPFLLVSSSRLLGAARSVLGTPGRAIGRPPRARAPRLLRQELDRLVEVERFGVGALRQTRAYGAVLKVAPVASGFQQHRLAIDGMLAQA